MNRILFISQPWHVRIRRAWRRRHGMAVLNERKSDPSERPISIRKAAAWTAIVLVTAVAYYLGEAVERKRQLRMEGLYSPTPTQPRKTLDCSTEGLRACRAQERLGKVKA